ncbi:MAG: glycosyltransferase [Deltaproteobacteria bacterium]|nr:glycosyltransferase [Deltaproteobacteria bacterium]MBW2152210.1 glycosyltransferase [Deltaproteobacteria bacterium]
MKVIGIVLVKNEDRFIERVVRNIVQFCDKIIILDNKSKDNTFEILTRLAAEFCHIELQRIRDVDCSHGFLLPYVNGDYWIFAVDGDEIYDPGGLKLFKERLKKGNYDRWWVIFGNVLNCTEINEKKGYAKGFLAPPSRSMTKLYNFSIIESWKNPRGERLKGGTICFKNGFNESLRYDLYKEIQFDDSYFRCLHACFTWRSSLDRKTSNCVSGRPNITESHGIRIREWMLRILFGRQPVSKWKLERYARGPLVFKDVTPFFPNE